MSTPQQITIRRFQDLDIKRHVLNKIDRNNHVVIQFPEALSHHKAAFIELLKDKLPEHHDVFDSGGGQGLTWVTVNEVISRTQLERIEPYLVSCARTFRQTATMLAMRVAENHGISPGNIWHEVRHLKPLPRPWKFDHHGGHLAFTNDATGQHVEVSIWFGDEFGVLDPQFFYEFMASTPGLSPPQELISPFHDTSRAFRFLKEKGHLKEVTGEFGFTGLFCP